MAYAAIGILPGGISPEARGFESALRAATDVTKPYAEHKEEVVRLCLKVYLDLLLERTGGNQSEASRLSGLGRSYLNKTVNAFGIRK